MLVEVSELARMRAPCVLMEARSMRALCAYLDYHFRVALCAVTVINARSWMRDICALYSRNIHAHCMHALCALNARICNCYYTKMQKSEYAHHSAKPT